MEQTNTSILSRFPEYGFNSTTLYNEYRFPSTATAYVFLTWWFGMIAFVGIVNFVIYYLLNLANPDDVAGVTCLILLILFIVIGLPVCIKILKKHPSSIQTKSFADYIQSKGRMRFFVKDGRFGLVQWKNFKIFIPAMYDKLMWVHENEVMKAYVNGEEFLIDIHNNKLS